MEIITDELGQVKVGNIILPGIFESLEISGTVRMDQVDIPGKEDKVTQAVGYDNARIRLTVYLYPPEDGGNCDEQIAVYQGIFRKSPDQEKPGVYKLVNRHAAARKINEVIFNDLKTWEDNRNEKVLVICEFTEHVPIQVKVKEKAAETTASAATQTTSSSSLGDFRKLDQASTTSRLADLGNFRMLDKASETPAKDDRKPGLASRVLAWIRDGDQS